MLTAPKAKSTYEPAPQGTFLARVVRLVHLGTVLETVKIPGQAPQDKMVNKIELSFELPTKKRVFSEERGEQPILIGKEFTLSMGPKANLRKAIESIIGATLKDHEADSFDVETVVGMPCVVTISHKVNTAGNNTAKITNISPVMEGQTCPEQINQSKILTFNKFEDGLFNSLPQYMKDRITKSEEYKKMVGNDEKFDESKNDELDGIDAEDIDLN